MFYSPLRYPGGKRIIAPLIAMMIEQSDHLGGTYIEPFAGGAGVAIELLEKGVVSKIVINDYDKRIYSFWRSILSETDRFVQKIEDIPLSIDEWNNQRDICSTSYKKYSFELGFATFYMNRTNRSGIIKGGVIGGLDQAGAWKLDARFNKKSLIERIRKIAQYKKSIYVYNKDILSFITHYIPKYENNAFIYFDPPYFNKSQQLYMNYLNYEDHEKIKKAITEKVKCDWVITYDDVNKVAELYNNYNLRKIKLNYSVTQKREASELMVFSNASIIPNAIKLKSNKIYIMRYK